MSQHPFTTPVKPDSNAKDPDMIPYLYTGLRALASTNAGNSAPATTYANMLWADTTNGLLKMRNQANSAWIVIGKLDTPGFIFSSGSSPVGALAAYHVGQFHINTATGVLSVATVAGGTIGTTTWVTVGNSAAVVKPVTAPYYATAATITIPAGNSAMTSGGVIITLAADRTIDLTATGAGGREANTTSEAANTWYYPWLIGDSTGANTPHAVWSNSAADIALPSGYDQKARLNGLAARNDGSSNIIPFTVSGWPYAPYCGYNVTMARPNGTAGPTSALEAAGGSASTSYADVTNTPKFIPPISTMGNFWFSGTAGSTAAVVTIRPNGQSHDGFGLVFDISTNRYPAVLVPMATDASQLIEYISSVGANGPKVQIAVAGWWG
jgi:hypothetical protein